MGVLSWIVFGLIAGALAKLIMPGDDPGGCIVTILLGVAGAFVGGFIGTQLGFGRVDGFDLRSLGIAIIGSIVLLLGYRFVMKRR
ncbi:MAG: GlsB/YeaQ/YmgE family stress response membrane protein [Pirellulales bacterium]